MQHLVILAPNWLGDAVMSLPAIADLRRAIPDAVLTIAARPAVAPLFALVPDVNDTIVLEPRRSIAEVGSWRAIGAELANRGLDAALLLPNSIQSALMAARAGIPERWGYRSALRAPLLTRAVARTSGLHQVEYYQRLVRALGFPSGPAEPRVQVPDQARAAGGRLLAASGWEPQRPLVALAPGAAYGSAKRWAPASFAELAASLIGDGVDCVLVGSAADAATATEVRRGIEALSRNPLQPVAAVVHDLSGRTDLPTLAGVLTHARTLVTNDSGAMHLAAAAGVPVTAVFGPTDDRATRPVGARHVVIAHPVWCRPCMLRECPIDHRCMRGVRVETVLDAARRTP